MITFSEKEVRALSFLPTGQRFEQWLPAGTYNAIGEKKIGETVGTRLVQPGSDVEYYVVTSLIDHKRREVINLNGPYEVHEMADTYSVVNKETGRVAYSALSRRDAIFTAVEMNG